MPPEENEIIQDGEFSWENYLKKTNSEAAPASCFCQHLIPPKNEFVVGNKLETYDPRNTTSTCIGTVIETNGPRLRLRLDGTDDRNDFWIMVDSDLIHPFEYSAKQGKKIQPPLGYGNDLSKWPKFLEKLVQTAGENVFAAETCFKPPPTKPIKNEFKIGQKLESVDPKNPHLICPATIKDIKRDKLLVTFDGWSQSSQFWCSFTSRDIFPCGWCKQAGHILQKPGALADKKSTSSTNGIVSPTSSSSYLKSKPKSTRSSSNSNRKNLTVDNPNELNESSDSSTLNITNDTINTKHASPNTTTATTPAATPNVKPIQPQPIQNQTQQSSSSSQSQSPSFQPTLTPTLSQATPINIITATTATATNSNSNNNHHFSIDLSIVKQEAFDPSDSNETASNILTNHELNKNHLNENTNLNLNTSYLSINSKLKHMANTIVYVIPNGDCGKYIKTAKFHSSHTKFGPGSPSNVYKSIIQSFVDCATNRLEVFKQIPEGTSHDFVRLKNVNYNERKRLILIDNVNLMWMEIKSFCQQLKIDDKQLFSKTRSPILSSTTTSTSAATSAIATETIDQNLSQIAHKLNIESSNLNNENSLNTTPTTNSSLLIAAASAVSAAANSKHNNLNETNKFTSNTNNINNSVVSNRPVNNEQSSISNQHSTTTLCLPLTPQPSCSASSSSSSSTSLSDNNNNNTISQPTTNENGNNNCGTSVDINTKSICQKRRSTTASLGVLNTNNSIGSGRPSCDQIEELNNENELNGHTSAKLYKLDTSLSSIPTTDWSVEQVVYYIYQLNDSNFSSYVDMFRHQEIDGKALLLLTTDILMKYMGFKLGPALKLNNYIEKLRKNIVSNYTNFNQITPKTECTN